MGSTMRAAIRAVVNRTSGWALFGNMYRRLIFRKQFREFRSLAQSAERPVTVRWKDRYPCLNDNTGTTGFDRHYVFHLAWAARVLRDTQPEAHVDISSSLYFCSIVSAFLPVKFYDYRPAALGLSNLTSESSDLLDLKFENDSIQSLSCMHVVEHVGLGRYGDQIDPDGDLKAMRELTRVLAPGGSLLFVVPIGQPKIQFNAHRIYSYEQIVTAFSGLELKEFALIPDNPQDGGLIYGATREQADQQRYGCGCFWFVKGSRA